MGTQENTCKEEDQNIPHTGSYKQKMSTETYGYDQTGDKNLTTTYPGPQSTVVMQPAPVMMGIAATPSQPYFCCGIVSSVIAFFCIPICGLPALVLSLMAYTDHTAGNMSSYHSKKTASCVLSGIAIGVGVLSFISVIIFVAVLANNVSDITNDIYNNMNNMNNDFNDFNGSD